MIDIRELRVGSHYYNTSYVKPVIGRITAINGSDRVSLCYDMPLDPDNDPFEGAMVHDLEPIPITAELLKEIGFKLFSDFDFRVGGTLDTGEYYIIVTDDEYHYWHCQITEQYGLKDDIVICCGFDALHQLENIVYIATEQELIKED